MPYFFIEDLPPTIQHTLPLEAQELYRETFNHIWDYLRDHTRIPEGHTRVELAARIAWTIVKQYYNKENGIWVKKAVTSNKHKTPAESNNQQKILRDKEKLLKWIDTLLSQPLPKPKTRKEE